MDPPTYSILNEKNIITSPKMLFQAHVMELIKTINGLNFCRNQYILGRVRANGEPAVPGGVIGV